MHHPCCHRPAPINGFPYPSVSIGAPVQNPVGGLSPPPPCPAPSSGPVRPRAHLVQHLGRDQDRARGRAAAARRRACGSRSRAPGCCCWPRVRAPAEDRLPARGDPRAAAVRARVRAHLLGRAVRAERAGRGAVRRHAAVQRRHRLGGADRRAAAGAARGRHRGRDRRAGAGVRREPGARATRSGRCWPPPRARSRRCAPRSATSRSSAAASGSTRSWSTAGPCSAAACCCSRPRAHRGLGATALTAQAIGSVAYLALIGSAVPFVTLTLLLRSCRP